MRVNLLQDKKLAENYIDIHYKEMNTAIQGIVEYCLCSIAHVL